MLSTVISSVRAAASGAVVAAVEWTLADVCAAAGGVRAIRVHVHPEVQRLGVVQVDGAGAEVGAATAPRVLGGDGGVLPLRRGRSTIDRLPRPTGEGSSRWQRRTTYSSS